MSVSFSLNAGTSASASASAAGKVSAAGSDAHTDQATDSGAAFEALLGLTMVTVTEPLATEHPASALADAALLQAANAEKDTECAEKTDKDECDHAVDSLLTQLPVAWQGWQAPPPVSPSQTVSHSAASSESLDGITLVNAADTANTVGPAVQKQLAAQASAAMPDAILTSVLQDASMANPETQDQQKPIAGAFAQALQPAMHIGQEKNIHAAASASVHAPLGSSSWPKEFSQQVSWLAKSDIQLASLTLNPPELGPVRVELQLNGAETTAHFSSPVHEVRQAIEGALPELKSLMEASGLSLTDASVNHGTQERRQRDDNNEKPDQVSNAATNSAADTGTTTIAVPAIRSLSKRLIDLYA